MSGIPVWLSQEGEGAVVCIDEIVILTVIGKVIGDVWCLDSTASSLALAGCGLCYCIPVNAS